MYLFATSDQTEPILKTASTFAGQTDHVFWLVTIICAVIFAGVCGFTLYCLVAYSRKKNPNPTQIEGNHTIEVMWTIIPTIIVLVMFYWGYSGFNVLRTMPSEGPLEIHVTGRMWAWDIMYYEYQKNAQGQMAFDDKGQPVRKMIKKMEGKMVVPVGRPIKLYLDSNDVLHSFYIPAFRIKEDAVPSLGSKMWFEATDTGIYQVLCAEYCGERHWDMRGKVHVVTQEEYDRWYNSKEDAPADQLAQAGDNTGTGGEVADKGDGKKTDDGKKSADTKKDSADKGADALKKAQDKAAQAEKKADVETKARKAAEEKLATEAKARKAAEEATKAAEKAKGLAEKKADAEAKARKAAEEELAAEAKARKAAEKKADAEAKARKAAEEKLAAEEKARKAAEAKAEAQEKAKNAVAEKKAEQEKALQKAIEAEKKAAAALKAAKEKAAQADKARKEAVEKAKEAESAKKKAEKKAAEEAKKAATAQKEAEAAKKEAEAAKKAAEDAKKAEEPKKEEKKEEPKKDGGE